MNSKDPEILSIYQFYLGKYLKNLNTTLPIHNQILEHSGFKILILDFCGISTQLISSKIQNGNIFFDNCDVFVVENQNEGIIELCKQYDLVYFFIYRLQPIQVEYPAIRVIFQRNKLVETDVTGI